MTVTRFVRPSDKKLKTCPLYAIFRDGRHIGNSPGRTSLEATQVYMFDALYDDLITDEETLSRFTAIEAVEGIHYGESLVSLADAAGAKWMQPIENPLKFIHLKDQFFGEFAITYHVNDGFMIDDLSLVTMKEQLLFQKMVSRNQQLNLMMVDSVFPLMMAEMATVALMKGPMTCAQYVQSGNPSHGEFLMEHKLHQFLHHLLYADVADEKPFNGILDYERVYYRKGGNEEVEYFPVHEQRALQSLIYERAMMEIDLSKSALKGYEATLVLRLTF